MMIVVSERPKPCLVHEDAPTFMPFMKRCAFNSFALGVLPKGLSVMGTSLQDTGSMAPVLEAAVLSAAGQPEVTSLNLSDLLSFSSIRSEPCLASECTMEM